VQAFFSPEFLVQTATTTRAQLASAAAVAAAAAQAKALQSPTSHSHNRRLQNKPAATAETAMNEKLEMMSHLAQRLSQFHTPSYVR
jgi:hypothetical protein